MHVPSPTVTEAHIAELVRRFYAAARAILPAEAATHAVARAEHRAESFKVGLFTFDRHIEPVQVKPAR